jgi:hypothetical protein
MRRGAGVSPVKAALRASSGGVAELWRGRVVKPLLHRSRRFQTPDLDLLPAVGKSRDVVH